MTCFITLGTRRVSLLAFAWQIASFAELSHTSSSHSLLNTISRLRIPLISPSRPPAAYTSAPLPCSACLSAPLLTSLRLTSSDVGLDPLLSLSPLPFSSSLHHALLIPVWLCVTLPPDLPCLRHWTSECSNFHISPFSPWSRLQRPFFVHRDAVSSPSLISSSPGAPFDSKAPSRLSKSYST